MWESVWSPQWTPPPDTHVLWVWTGFSDLLPTEYNKSDVTLWLASARLTPTYLHRLVYIATMFAALEKPTWHRIEGRIQLPDKKEVKPAAQQFSKELNPSREMAAALPTLWQQPWETLKQTIQLSDAWILEREAIINVWFFKLVNFGLSWQSTKHSASAKGHPGGVETTGLDTGHGITCCAIHELIGSFHFLSSVLWGRGWDQKACGRKTGSI